MAGFEGGFAPYTVDGLRGIPVASALFLAAISARNFELRKVVATSKVYEFVTGKTPVGTDIADNAATGAWVEVVTGSPVVLNIYPTLAAATLALGVGKQFRWSQGNTAGVPSPNNATIGVT